MKLKLKKLRRLIKEEINEISFVDAFSQRMKREKNPYSSERDFKPIQNTPELQQMLNSLEEPEEKDSPWAPGSSPKEDSAPLERVRQTLPKIIEDPQEYQWDAAMAQDIEEYVTWLRDNPEDPKDTELGGVFIPGGFLDLRKKFPSLFKSTKLRRQLGLDSEFEGSEDATNPGFGPRKESVEKLTPKILRELIKEEIDNKLNEIDPGLVSLGAEVFGDPETMRAFGTSAKTLGQMGKAYFQGKFGNKQLPPEREKTASEKVSDTNAKQGFKDLEPNRFLNRKHLYIWDSEAKERRKIDFSPKGAEVLLGKLAALLKDRLTKSLELAASNVDDSYGTYVEGLYPFLGAYAQYVGKHQAQQMESKWKNFTDKDKILGYINMVNNPQFIRALAAGYLFERSNYDDLVDWSIKQLENRDIDSKTEAFINEEVLVPILESETSPDRAESRIPWRLVSHLNKQLNPSYGVQ